MKARLVIYQKVSSPHRKSGSSLEMMINMNPWRMSGVHHSVIQPDEKYDIPNIIYSINFIFIEFKAYP